MSAAKHTPNADGRWTPNATAEERRSFKVRRVSDRAARAELAEALLAMTELAQKWTSYLHQRAASEPFYKSLTETCQARINKAVAVLSKAGLA